MERVHYSEQFKQAIVERFLTRGPRPAMDIARETGVCLPTIYRWQSQLGYSDPMQKGPRSPQDWKTEERFKAVIEYEKLSEDQRGLFLRKEGLHTHQIDQWKEQMKKGLEPSTDKKRGRPKKIEYQKQFKELERELRIKEKALAEVTALLVLKKKADLIWGKGEDNE